MTSYYQISNFEQCNIDSIYKSKLIFETKTDEKVYRLKDSIIVKLPKNRNSLTTSWINGGYVENIEAIFNHQLKLGINNPDGLEGYSVSDYMKIIAERLNLNPERVTGLITSADMEKVSISNKCFRDLEVTAIITGGVNVNGGRAGDPAAYFEKDNKFFEYKIGTINTILIINSQLDESTLLTAMMTAIESKTVALQELMAPSKYSTSIATGSGTDKISIVSNMESKNVLTDAGKHSKLGELIGKCVIEATKCALAKQTNLTPKSQFSMMKRLNRFDIDEEKYWEIATSTYRTDQESEFIKELHYFSQNPLVVAMISSILHIVDEIQWKLIPELTGKKTALLIMNTLPEVLKIKDFPKNENIITENDSIIESWIKISSWCILNSS
ncbi:MAG: hypothetical protein CVV28_07020 [Methanobacteriales archaeon HGW-Methanobacteriales-1]|jgi:adenosylcobinamide hydrolase|nr:MAG: hypothetical protein CVV28_07020 [Methanobacteriales archaeon HGW-Methanobacteriales-1]